MSDQSKFIFILYRYRHVMEKNRILEKLSPNFKFRQDSVFTSFFLGRPNYQENYHIPKYQEEYNYNKKMKKKNIQREKSPIDFSLMADNIPSMQLSQAFKKLKHRLVLRNNNLPTKKNINPAIKFALPPSKLNVKSEYVI